MPSPRPPSHPGYGAGTSASACGSGRPATRPPYDALGGGCSALEAAILRAARNELAALRGDCVANASWGIVDTIDVPALIEHTVRLQYPPASLLVGLTQHTAPRCLALGRSAAALVSAA